MYYDIWIFDTWAGDINAFDNHALNNYAKKYIFLRFFFLKFIGTTLEIYKKKVVSSSHRLHINWIFNGIKKKHQKT